MKLQLIIKKCILKGPLKGMTVEDHMTFVSRKAALKWVRDVRNNPKASFRIDSVIEKR
jgi:hypothetical protein